MSMLFNIAAVIAVVVGLGYLYSLSSSERWAETTGQITKLEVRERISRVSSSNSNTVEFVVDVEFSYTVNGAMYTGTQIYPALPNVFSHQSDLDTFLSEYTKGANVRVFYNQEKPERSALRKPHISTLGYMVLLIFVVLVFIGIFYAANRYVFND